MLSIARVTAESRDRYVLVKVSLENRGASVVGPGTMLGRQTSTGGATRLVEFRNSTNILPGCTANVSQLLSALKELQFTGYRQSDGVVIPFSGGMVKRLSLVGSFAAVTARWWDEVLLPRSTSLVARVNGKNWSLAELNKQVKDGAQVVGNALASIDAEIVRWCGGVLVPRSTSIAARLRTVYGTAWIRLEIDKRANHGAMLAAEAWRSKNAEVIRWRDEVLAPRTRSIAAQFKALHKNAWLRLTDARQQRKQRAQVERQAWESVDAEIMRWWDEVLLPRSRSIAARTKEALRHDRWTRIATEIHKRVDSYRARRRPPR